MTESHSRFLVIRLSSIGDIVHALPAVAALGQTFPEADIHWAVEDRFASLLEGNPSVHQAVKLDTHGWRKRLASAQTLEEAGRSVLDLRRVRYDAVIDFQGLYKSGLLAWLSGSRQRVGFAENWLREPGVAIFYTERVAPRGRRHVIEMNLALVERLGARLPPPSGWSFPLPRTESADRYVDRELKTLGVSDFIILNPGGGWARKRWPPGKYAHLIRRLEREGDATLLLTGSAEEEHLIREILQGARATRARYVASDLVQFVALTRRARLFVGGDTGPMHLAAAVGTPVVAIFGETDSLNTPERNGPFSPDDIVLSPDGSGNHARERANAGDAAGVSVESVFAAVRRRLARAHG